MKQKNSYKGNFQKNLKRTSTNRIIILILISGLLFSIGQFIAEIVSNEINAQHHMEILEANAISFDSACKDFIEDLESNNFIESLILEPDVNVDKLRSKLWHFKETKDFEINVILNDQNFETMYTSFGENVLTTYLLDYNAAVCNNTKKIRSSEPYRAIFFDRNIFSDTMYVKPIGLGTKPIGYLTVFLSGSSWNAFLSNSNYDGVITDKNNNAMYTSKLDFLIGGISLSIRLRKLLKMKGIDIGWLVNIIEPLMLIFIP